ncbi:GntR family transcriptional regulator [Streptomyces sp. NPDC051776]|uniref:GntR family transcriptional regulator n=1 Tax=Streptomyces sp. NPDC051776 TaxID=3155414 RepID=UPI00342C640B
MSRTTLVEQVRDELLHELSTGKLVPGDKLPNEDALADRFDVSRATVREAVRVLVESGYVSRVHGSGTYVTRVPRREHALDASLSYTRMIAAAGAEPGVRILDARFCTAPADIAERLVSGSESLEVLRVERVRTADDRPVVYSVDQIPRAFVPDVELDRIEPSLHAMLAAHGHTVRQATARLLPVVADTRLARILRVRRGAPLQHIDQTDVDATGRPAMVSAEWHVPDVFELRINRRA